MHALSVPHLELLNAIAKLAKSELMANATTNFLIFSLLKSNLCETIIIIFPYIILKLYLF